MLGLDGRHHAALEILKQALDAPETLENEISSILVNAAVAYGSLGDQNRRVNAYN